MTRDECREVIVRIVADIAVVSEDNISDQDDLREDLGLDSLDLSELFMDIQEETGKVLQESNYDSCKTIGDFVDALEKETQ